MMKSYCVAMATFARCLKQSAVLAESAIPDLCPLPYCVQIARAWFFKEWPHFHDHLAEYTDGAKVYPCRACIFAAFTVSGRTAARRSRSMLETSAASQLRSCLPHRTADEERDLYLTSMLKLRRAFLPDGFSASGLVCKAVGEEAPASLGAAEDAAQAGNGASSTMPLADDTTDRSRASNSLDGLDSRAQLVEQLKTRTATLLSDTVWCDL